jgi:hypothetical protein
VPWSGSSGILPHWSLSREGLMQAEVAAACLPPPRSIVSYDGAVGG